MPADVVTKAGVGFVDNVIGGVDEGLGFHSLFEELAELGMSFFCREKDGNPGGGIDKQFAV